MKLKGPREIFRLTFNFGGIPFSMKNVIL